MLLAIATCGAGRFLPAACEFLPEFAFEPLEPAFQRAEARLQRIVLAPNALQHEKLQYQNGQANGP